VWRISPVCCTPDEQPHPGAQPCTETQSVNQRRVGGWPGSFSTTRAHGVRTWSFLPNASHAQHDMRSCGPPHCGGGALCGQRREGRQYVRELPGCPLSRGQVMHALGRPQPPSLADGQAKPWCRTGLNPFLALSDAHASLTLRQAATRRGRAPTGRTPRRPTRCLAVSERARSRASQPPGGMKLAERQRQAPVGCCGCVTPAAAWWGGRGVSTRDATTRGQGIG